MIATTTIGQFVRRARSRSAQIRLAFIEADSGGALAPMARLLRGGRGGEVRVKLYLSLLWFAAKPPHDVTIPAYYWAELLGLPDFAANGARRVSDALVWLNQNQFVQLARQPGRESKVTLLREDGSGEPYEVPGAVASRSRRRSRRLGSDEALRFFYVSIPSGFWENRWIASLPGPAVVMLLALLDESRRRQQAPEVWLVPDDADARYGVSADTRSVGLRDLVSCGIVAVRRASASAPLEYRRARNIYKLELDRFGEHAPGIVGYLGARNGPERAP